MARISPTIACCLFSIIVERSVADPFLQKVATSSLLSDVQLVLGPDCFRGRLENLKNHLQPMFTSLPKDSRGLLSHSAARYALHRISTVRHGWTINGLAPSIENINTSSLVSSGILRELLPEHIESIFERHIGESGFSLQNLVILAGTIDQLVREDQRNILRKACELLDVPTLGAISEENLKNIIQLYMVSFLRANMVPPEIFARHLMRIWTNIAKEYPGWVETTLLLDDERLTFAYNEKNRANPFRESESSLEVALRVVEQVADHFPHQQAQPECLEIKEDLLAYERGDTGRLRLVDFYRAGLSSRFYFIESKEYLRSMGALDETDSRVGPKVIVSNYVLAKSNCLARAHLYQVCCIDECEGLYGQFEQAIAEPDAKPQQIVKLVANMSSSTVQAPRNLSQALLQRLDDIAVGSGGKVLLHSRLFAQWMHEAFPRECPYPHRVGTTSSLDPKAWAKHTGLNFSVGKKRDLQSHIESLELAEEYTELGQPTDDDVGMMWTSEEEYFVEPVRSRVWTLMGAFGSGCVFVALGAGLLYAKFSSPVLSGDTKDAKIQQFFV